MIICTSFLVETSPQALPLGVACVASAIKHSIKIAQSKSQKIYCVPSDVIVYAVSAEDNDMIPLNDEGRGKLFAQKILQKLEKSSDSTEQNTSSLDTFNFPPIICFSVYMWNHKLLEVCARELKRQIPNVICIAGGPEVTANTVLFSQYKCEGSEFDTPKIAVFDYVIAGEGEIIVPQIIGGLTKTQQNKGKSIKTNTESKCVELSSQIHFGKQSDPATLESPYLDGTIDPADYDGALWELARGCPFKCSYCYESKGGKKVVYFPVNRIYKELDLFAKKKIGQVFVLDPTYNADKKRALEMLRYIKKHAPDIYFYFECRAEFLDRPLAQAFADINCSLQIGLQSSNPEVLALVHRSLDKKKFVRNIGILNEYGAIFGLDLIYGLPGDTLKGFRESIDFSLNLYPNHVELFRLAVLPGTDLYDRAESLHITFLKDPPYLVQSVDTFSKQDLLKAEKLSRACNLFYSTGRAVPWFLSILKPLKKKASAFFDAFDAFLDVQSQKGGILSDLQLTAGAQNTAAGADIIVDYSQLSHKRVEKLQLEFVKQQYEQKNLKNLINLVQDIILLNGAFSRAEAEKEKSSLSLHYHPDDLLSPYAQDVKFFVQNAQKLSCRVEVFFSKNGPDYRILGKK